MNIGVVRCYYRGAILFFVRSRVSPRSTRRRTVNAVQSAVHRSLFTTHDRRWTTPIKNTKGVHTHTIPIYAVIFLFLTRVS